MYVDEIISRCRAYAHLRGWTSFEYARRAGLHPNTLRNYRDERWNPRVETLRKIASLVPPDFDPRKTEDWT